MIAMDEKNIAINPSEIQGVTYDRYGRMNYHPEIHGNQKMPWTVTDQKYLIENYDLLGPEQLSFDLERTIHTVMQRACQLRKQGVMTKPAKRNYHQRMRSQA